MFVFLFSIIASIGHVSCDCQSGWVRYNNSCYNFEHFEATWTEAQFFCHTLKAYLIEIHDRYEDNFIKTTLQGIHQGHLSDLDNYYGYWMGLHDVEVEKEFVWSTSRTHAHFVDWETGQPDNTFRGIEDEDCVFFDSSGGFKWNDSNCALKKFFICEKPSDVS